MAATSGGDSIRAILLDIEGTTTPIDFVFKTLFPYARRGLGQFLSEHGGEPEVRADVEALRRQHRADAAENLSPPRWAESSPELDLEPATAYGIWLMDCDSKCSALKSLQGKIWQEGFRSGELQGEVYPDVPPAFGRWSSQGKIICIFSSGSVLAQKLLFGNTAAGDLTGYLRAYFDTTVGPKNEPDSYLKIAKALALAPPEVLFISDVVKELDAAQAAGMHTALSLRPGTAEPVTNAHRVVHSFDGIFSVSQQE